MNKITIVTIIFSLLLIANYVIWWVDKDMKLFTTIPFVPIMIALVLAEALGIFPKDNGKTIK